MLNGNLPLPQARETLPRAPMYEAAVLNKKPQPETLPGRDITARGMGDEALARGLAEEARFEAALEAERRADDPNYDLYGGNRSYQRNHIDDMFDSFEAEAYAQLEAEALAGLDPNSMMTKVGYRPNAQAVWGAMGVPGQTFRDGIGRAEWPQHSADQREALKVTANFINLRRSRLRTSVDIGMKNGEEWTGMW